MNSTRFGTLAAGFGAALAGLGLLAGCVEQTSAPPPPAAAMPAPPPPAAPQPEVVVEQTPVPAQAMEPSRIMVLRETPPPPAHWRMVDRGGLPPVARVVLVSLPPPAPKEEQHTRHPSTDVRQVWAGGHWRYYAGRYIWIPGKWVIPPVPHAVFVPPHWEMRGEGHVFIEGYWQL